MRFDRALLAASFLIAAAFTGCGDSTTDGKAISCQLEVAKSPVAVQLGDEIGDSVSTTILSQTATFTVFDDNGVTRLRADILAPPELATPTSAGLPAGVLARSEAELPDKASAGGLILAGSVTVKEGLLSYACVWR